MEEAAALVAKASAADRSASDCPLASSALDLAGNFVRQAPASALSPIVDEKASLDRDLARAGEFLYASLP